MTSGCISGWVGMLAGCKLDGNCNEGAERVRNGRKDKVRSVYNSMMNVGRWKKRNDSKARGCERYILDG
jgi:hypothetical protein